ncbi:eukaryotic translation initiation factor 3 subunit J [Galendromus occidentalis]|uniref:Eukaryotic translation initiation factor 3 subunit J n=1 Tax=Galendromus occidentalis TaxID=34638 RepID=A0AAJ6QVD4_9ACAR|nr:eukaryotic translation initiation factor 3 subunit J [Galendromus occidentalis]
MSDDWETADITPVVKPSDRWEGEDEDDVKDNWDDEDEDDQSDSTPVVASQPKKKKTLQQILAEKEEKKRKEAEERRLKLEAEAKNNSPEEQNREKLRRQRMQEEADLRTAMETCGVSATGTIDSMVPVDKDDYDNLRKLLVAKLSPNESSPLYVGFLEELLRDLTANLEVDDIRKLSSTVNTVVNEKIKMTKLTKGKKKKQGTSLKVERDERDTFDDYGGGEFDDFM